ncbi:hypothetical protein LIER_11193 [Lithospermum erythrorhizon]|uniref:Uncharacterized protein n=1 Tax=Lithospermum erythrorhizon TaxID=34254 RepID=A0AAV3PNP0_LITER
MPEAITTILGNVEVCMSPSSRYLTVKSKYTISQLCNELLPLTEKKGLKPLMHQSLSSFNCATPLSKPLRVVAKQDREINLLREQLLLLEQRVAELKEIIDHFRTNADLLGQDDQAHENAQAGGSLLTN